MSWYYYYKVLNDVEGFYEILCLTRLAIGVDVHSVLKKKNSFRIYFCFYLESSKSFEPGFDIQANG